MGDAPPGRSSSVSQPWGASGGGAPSGNIAGSVGALPDVDTVNVPLDTSVVGFAEGFAVVTATSEAT